MPWRSPDRRDAVRQISVDVIVEREPAVGARRVAPIHDVKIDAEIEEIADERAVLLQVGHRVAADQPIDDQHRRRDLLLGERPVVMQRDLVLTPDLILRRRGDRHVLVAQLGKQRRAARDLFAQGRGLRDRLLGLDMNGRAAARHDDVLRFGSYWPHEWSTGLAGCLGALRRGLLLARGAHAPRAAVRSRCDARRRALRASGSRTSRYKKPPSPAARDAGPCLPSAFRAGSRGRRSERCVSSKSSVRGLNPKRQHLAP